MASLPYQTLTAFIFARRGPGDFQRILTVVSFVGYLEG